jgi:TRAP-type C4-dicarboxylate transport system substrate-binding protein
MKLSIEEQTFLLKAMQEVKEHKQREVEEIKQELDRINKKLEELNKPKLGYGVYNDMTKKESNEHK